MENDINFWKMEDDLNFLKIEGNLNIFLIEHNLIFKTALTGQSSTSDASVYLFLTLGELGI